ncbi:MAG: ParA family protein [Nitrososphaerota archaeon]
MTGATSMTWVIAVTNQKGGVGKTTSVINLSAALASRHGFKVLLIDMDPQGHLGLSLGVKPLSTSETIAAPLMGVRKLSEVIHETSIGGLRIVPSNEDLAAVEEHLARQPGREAVLRAALDGEVSGYDAVLIDTPPSLGVLTFNAIYAADYLLVPIQPRLYSIEGLRRLYKIIELMRTRLGRRIEILGHFLTMVDNRYKITHEVREDLRARLGDGLLRSEIPSSVRVEEGHFYRSPVVTYAPDTPVANAYLELALEVISRLTSPASSPSITTMRKSEEMDRITF